MPWVSRAKIEQVEERLVKAEKRLTMLECLHTKVEFVEDPHWFWLDYVKKCALCGKILESYYTQLEYETARIAHEEAKLAAAKKDLLGAQSKGKKK